MLRSNISRCRWCTFEVDWSIADKSFLFLNYSHFKASNSIREDAMPYIVERPSALHRNNTNMIRLLCLKKLALNSWCSTIFEGSDTQPHQIPAITLGDDIESESIQLRRTSRTRKLMNPHLAASSEKLFSLFFCGVLFMSNNGYVWCIYPRLPIISRFASTVDNMTLTISLHTLRCVLEPIRSIPLWLTLTGVHGMCCNGQHAMANRKTWL